MALCLYAATTSAGKLRDFRTAAQAYNVAIEPLSGIENIPAPAEDGSTFAANATLKAVYYSRFAPGELVIADDSGLETDALSGAPGVRSARFAADAGMIDSPDANDNTDVWNNNSRLSPTRSPGSSATSSRWSSPLRSWRSSRGRSPSWLCCCSRHSSYPARRIGRKLQLLTREAYNLNAQMNNMMTERFNVSGALLVKLFNRPDIEHDQFAGRAARVRNIGVQTAMYGRVFFLSLILTSSLATALVYGWGGVLAVNGRFKVGTVVALAALLTRLYGPLTALSNVNVDVMTALVSFDRVFEVLDLPPLIAEQPDAVDIARGLSQSSSTTSTSATPRRRRCRSPRSSRSPSWTRRRPARFSTT